MARLNAIYVTFFYDIDQDHIAKNVLHLLLGSEHDEAADNVYPDLGYVHH